MTTVASIITSVGYDLKLTSTESTSRTNEMIEYMNRCISGHIIPNLARFKSDMGMKKWTTTETTAYLAEYSLPSDFYSFYALYARTYLHAGTLASAASATSLVLDSSASTGDDAYNGYILRLTSGTYADEQRYVTDYTGSTLTATTAAFSGTPSTDTFVIVEPWTKEHELTQMEMSELLEDHTGAADCPNVYALMTDTTLLLGPTPDNATAVLYGLYYYKPTALSATTDSLPFNTIFDNIIRAYVSQSMLLRDEYNVSAEEALRTRIEADITLAIRERQRRKPGAGQSKIRGSND